jgi:C4-type Zn-finger protein
VLFENEATKCPNCWNQLVWIDHIKRWEHASEIDEFNFSCGSCKRQYQFIDDKIIEKRQGHNAIAETKPYNLATFKTL